MGCIIDFERACSLSKTFQIKEKTVGLITGCFDVIHIGHIELFKYTSAACDILFVGVEPDLSIKRSKGEFRPKFNIGNRLEVLSAIRYVDFVFAYDHKVEFGTIESRNFYLNLYRKISPTFISSSKECDSLFTTRELQGEFVDIQILDIDRQKLSSSSEIISDLKEVSL